MQVPTKIWTTDEVKGLGVRTDFRTACKVIGIGESTGYQMVRSNRFPIPVLRLGRKYVVPVAGLLDALGIDVEPSNIA